MSNMLRFLLAICIISHLVACFSLESKSKLKLAKRIETVNWYQQKKNCNQQTLTTNNCPSFKFDGITFKHQPLLNNLIEQKLLSLVKAKNQSLWDYQQSYLAKAHNGDHIYFTVKVLKQTTALTVLQLSCEEQHSTYVYSTPNIAFINFDNQTKQDLQLTDIIQGDQLPAFWSNAQLVYNQWLEVNQLLNNEVYHQDWPFVKTLHFALLTNGIMLQYEANTLAPYAMGMPTLVIPYNKLEGIVKPQYIIN